MQAIDWNEKWLQDRGSACWKARPPESWNNRAEAFARRTSRSLYAGRFIELLQPQPEWSVLDMGSGPGTLALPLAERVRRITAVDFSSSMLELLRQQATARGLDNITTIEASWDDDWSARGIKMHDLAIASRSLSVKDLRQALEKLDRIARVAVYLSDRVGPGPFDPAAYAALGRELKPGPDYIYTINLLHQMGMLPRVDYIELDEPQLYGTLDEAVRNYSWMFKDLSPEETSRLRDYIERQATTAPDGQLVVQRDRPPVWALIWWPVRSSLRR
ncbi:MAG: hypothetical protein BWK76_24785 [Desulfobulbaceae bacterium A2]|nr:MAG: hypothetical protein BWK76_24785 [Desulfobulbaceae bacterium A2]